ncbi:hypothetical protein V1527DRAFT_453618 [Lipomyces starkeyi]
MFWNELFNNYATATEVAEVDFVRLHEPAIYLFMRTSQCMNRDSADDCEADTDSEDNDSWYGRLITDARSILDGSDSSGSTDSTDNSNYSDAGNMGEDIATSDETVPLEEQKVWVQHCPEELFPIESGGLALQIEAPHRDSMEFNIHHARYAFANEKGTGRSIQ